MFASFPFALLALSECTEATKPRSLQSQRNSKLRLFCTVDILDGYYLQDVVHGGDVDRELLRYRIGVTAE